MITKSLIGEKPHAWSLDPHLDQAAPGFQSAYDTFLKTGDISVLPKKEGMSEPTVFWFAPLSRVQFLRVMSEERSFFRINDAVAYALRRVDRFRRESMPGSFEDVQLSFHGNGDDKRVSTESLNQIFDLRLFTELGGRIIELSSILPL